MNNANAVNNVVGVSQLTGAVTDGCGEDVDQDGITKVKIVDEISTDSCLKCTIKFPNLKRQRQLQINNYINLNVRTLIFERLDLESKFIQNLNILILETPKKIWIPKVKNRYIPFDCSDDIDDGFIDDNNNGKAVFKPNVDWKAHRQNDIIISNHTED